jgi:hypothetical protein
MKEMIDPFYEPFLVDSETENYSPQVEKLIVDWEEERERASSLDLGRRSGHDALS